MYEYSKKKREVKIQLHIKAFVYEVEQKTESMKKVSNNLSNEIKSNIDVLFPINHH